MRRRRAASPVTCAYSDTSRSAIASTVKRLPHQRAGARRARRVEPGGGGSRETDAQRLEVGGVGQEAPSARPRCRLRTGPPSRGEDAERPHRKRLQEGRGRTPPFGSGKRRRRRRQRRRGFRARRLQELQNISMGPVARRTSPSQAPGRRAQTASISARPPAPRRRVVSSPPTTTRLKPSDGSGSPAQASTSCGMPLTRLSLATVRSNGSPSRRSGSDPIAVQSGRIAGASCATGCRAAVSTAIPSGTVQTRSGRTASNEGPSSARSSRSAPVEAAPPARPPLAASVRRAMFGTRSDARDRRPGRSRGRAARPPRSHAEPSADRVRG